MKDIARDGPATRERVVQRVKELGYQPNWVARSLVTLSTVDQSSSPTGKHAADLLLDLVESKRPPRPRTILLTPMLLVRDSTNR